MKYTCLHCEKKINHWHRVMLDGRAFCPPCVEEHLENLNTLLDSKPSPGKQRPRRKATMKPESYKWE